MKVSKNVKSVKAWGLKENNKIILNLIFRTKRDAIYNRNHFACAPSKQEVVPVEIRQLKQLKRTK